LSKVGGKNKETEKSSALGGAKGRWLTKRKRVRGPKRETEERQACVGGRRKTAAKCLKEKKKKRGEEKKTHKSQRNPKHSNREGNPRTRWRQDKKKEFGEKQNSVDPTSKKTERKKPQTKAQPMPEKKKTGPPKGEKREKPDLNICHGKKNKGETQRTEEKEKSLLSKKKEKDGVGALKRQDD